jgi:hypothetical protein
MQHSVINYVAWERVEMSEGWGDRIAQESLLSDLNEIKIKSKRKTTRKFDILDICRSISYKSFHITITSRRCLYRRLCYVGCYDDY